MHQQVAPNLTFFTVVVHTYMRVKYEPNPDYNSIIQYLEYSEQNMLPKLFNGENEFEYTVYRVLLWSLRSTVYWRAKLKEQGN